MPSITQEAKDAILRYVEAESNHRSEDAVNSLNGLKNIIESFPVSDGWIPVSERLPEDGKVVLAFDFIVEKAQYLEELEGFFTVSTEPCRMNAPSHWQPLPNPPTSHK